MHPSTTLLHRFLLVYHIKSKEKRVLEVCSCNVTKCENFQRVCKLLQGAASI